MRILPGDHRTASAVKISAPMEAQTKNSAKIALWMRILPGDHRTASVTKISVPMEAQSTKNPAKIALWMRILPGDHRTASTAMISTPMEAQSHWIFVGQTAVMFGVPKASGQCFDGTSYEVTIDLTSIDEGQLG
ncbi:hypothetical protein GOBAR_AA24898 [Gossypium barbadense]|uniref:Uncharacterized protein n=1 Tax=Gossypium barbadense TaxID=3634 RepID=A0A2P5WXL4_GOSBA|nr:hypothetical protein GOBAR_AA24898 [Gossypium barbadense]